MASTVKAVPSFTRQTGLACSACHYVPPELNPFGRRFKLHGYTLTAMKQDRAISEPSIAGLQLNDVIPLSAMFITANTSVKKAQPGSVTSSTQFPQQFSVFLAGEMTPHVGGFIQATYSQADDHLGLDNTDIRYTNSSELFGKGATYGVTLNNNPTVEDPWNSTPAWGFPWIGPDSSPSPGASPLIRGGLAQDVAGVGGYMSWNSFLYGNVTVYQSAHLGGSSPPTGVGFQYNIDGAAPYWRFAAEHAWGANYLMVGTYGMHVKTFATGVSGLSDRYTDNAADFQYERTFRTRHVLTAHGTYTRENMNLQGTAALSGQSGSTAKYYLNNWRLDANYHYGDRLRLTAGVFGVTGSRNSLFYTPGAVNGSANSRPDSQGYILQAGYWPWQNLDITLAYTGYTKFNGLSHNYDGAGRNASDNNSVYIAAWFIF